MSRAGSERRSADSRLPASSGERRRPDVFQQRLLHNYPLEPHQVKTAPETCSFKTRPLIRITEALEVPLFPQFLFNYSTASRFRAGDKKKKWKLEHKLMHQSLESAETRKLQIRRA